MCASSRKVSASGAMAGPCRLSRKRSRCCSSSSKILDAVWRETFVTENALTREIAQLRKALGEEARRAKYIETVPTRGYRFIAEVEDARAESSGAAPANGA